ncbi:MAG: hypothetical protein WD794_15965 [Mycobacteriales bacterium]
MASKPGSSVSAEEFRVAREVMMAIHQDARWNLWIERDRADELEHAMAAFDQWARAEPDHRPMNDSEVKDMLAGWEADWKREWSEACAAREERKAQFDPDRSEARLALLERQAQLNIATRRHGRLVSGELHPAMSEERRRAAIAEERERSARATDAVASLSSQVGDPEQVVDAQGWLPSERRDIALTGFSLRRQREVERLRATVAELPATLKATTGREPRAEVRSRLRSAESELAFWLAIPPLQAEEMCSECEDPLDWHERDGHLGSQPTGPCPWWPGWRARVQKARDMILSFAAARQAPPGPPAPKPQPIAILKSGTPIEQVIAKLTRISAEHPAAEVRRGNADRWEIWPAKHQPVGTPEPKGT